MMWKIQIVSTEYLSIQNDGVLVVFNQTQGHLWCTVSFKFRILKVLFIVVGYNVQCTYLMKHMRL